MLRREWSALWVGYSGARMTKQFYPRPDKNKPKTLLRLGRQELTLMVNAVTGHNELPHHVSLCGEAETGVCSHCGEQEGTFYHLLMDCPVFTSLRLKIFGLDAPCADGKWNTGKVLKFARYQAVEVEMRLQIDAITSDHGSESLESGSQEDRDPTD